jgi:secondary thiamine-phosphate synthase enzyme
MTPHTGLVRFMTMGEGDISDLTDRIQEIVTLSGQKEGVAVIFCPGSTGAVTTIEFEPGLVKDVPAALERIAPKGNIYAHHATWGDDNGSGHVKAAILGPDLTVPFSSGRLDLGRWQQIVFIECDTSARDRKLIVKVIGE